MNGMERQSSRAGTAIAIIVALSVMIYFLNVAFTSKTTEPGKQNIAANVEGKTLYNIYFGNHLYNKSSDCGAVYPVSRAVIGSGSKEAALLLELTNGPTDREKQRGYNSFFSPKTSDALISVSVREGAAYVNFRDVRQIIANVISSCGSKAFLSSIETTLEQLKGIEKVIFAINGDPKTFYEWLKLTCGPENGNCDKTPFR